MEDLALTNVLASFFPEGQHILDELPFPTDTLKEAILTTKVS